MLNEYLSSFLIFNAIDLVEILFFSILIYCCSIWLKTDKQKNLLLTFYALFVVLVFTNFANMPTISNFFITFFPVILTVFFLMHQRTLQKNFVALKKISVSGENSSINWIEDFMRACFNAMNNNKQITCIVEGNNSLIEFIKAPFPISTPVNKELINILINSQNFDQQKMLWLTCEGKINSINATWNIKNYDLWFDKNSQNIDNWQQDAIIFTSKFDCILFRTYPAKRTIDIIIQGRLIENLSSNSALNLLEQFIKKNEIKNIKKDRYNNEIKPKDNWSKQQPYT